MKIHRVMTSYIQRMNDETNFQWRASFHLKRDVTHLEILLVNKQNGRAWKGVVPVSMINQNVIDQNQFTCACGPDGAPKIWNRNRKTKWGEFFSEVTLLERATPSQENIVTLSMTDSQYKALLSVVNYVIENTNDATTRDQALLGKDVLLQRISA